MTNLNKDWLDEQMECAIREKGAIDHFRELENKPSFSGMFQRFIRPAVVSFAVVCAAACAYIPYYGHMARSGYEYSLQQEYDTLRYRGDSPLLDKLNDVIALVNNRKPQEALALLETLESDCDAASAQFGDTDEYIVESTATVELAMDGNKITANVKKSATAKNALVLSEDGLFVLETQKLSAGKGRESLT